LSRAPVTRSTDSELIDRLLAMTLPADLPRASGPALSSAYNLVAAVKRARDRLAAERRTNKFLFLVEADRKLGKRG
jgi:hypothetical protein